MNIPITAANTISKPKTNFAAKRANLGGTVERKNAITSYPFFKIMIA